MPHWLTGESGDLVVAQTWLTAAAAGSRRAPVKPTAPSGSCAAAPGTSCTTTTSMASGRPASSGGATWPAAATGRSAAAQRPSDPSVRVSGRGSRPHRSTPWCGLRGRALLQTGTSLCHRRRRTSDGHPSTLGWCGFIGSVTNPV